MSHNIILRHISCIISLLVLVIFDSLPHWIRTLWLWDLIACYYYHNVHTYVLPWCYTAIVWVYVGFIQKCLHSCIVAYLQVCSNICNTICMWWRKEYMAPVDRSLYNIIMYGSKHIYKCMAIPRNEFYHWKH